MVLRRLPPEPRPSDVESPRREEPELTPESLRPYGYTPLVYSYGVPLSAGPRAPIGAGVASAVTFLAGLWLVIAPYALNYATGVEAQWNDLVVGGVIALLAPVRAFAPANVPWFSIVNVALGVARRRTTHARLPRCRGHHSGGRGQRHGRRLPGDRDGVLQRGGHLSTPRSTSPQHSSSLPSGYPNGWRTAWTRVYGKP